MYTKQNRREMTIKFLKGQNLRCAFLLLLFGLICLDSFPQLVPFRVINKWTFSNLDGKILTKELYDSVYTYKASYGSGMDYRYVFKDGKTGLVDSMAKEMVPPKFDEINFTNSHKSILKIDSEYVFTDNPFSERFDLKYNYFKYPHIGSNYYSDEIILVKKNNKWGIIGNSNLNAYQELIPAKYDSITSNLQNASIFIYLWQKNKKSFYKSLQKKSYLEKNNFPKPKTVWQDNPKSACKDEYQIRDTIGGYYFKWRKCQEIVKDDILTGKLEKLPWKNSEVYDSIVHYGYQTYPLLPILFGVKNDNKWSVLSVLSNIFVATYWYKYDSIRFLYKSNYEITNPIGTNWFLGFKEGKIELFDICLLGQDVRYSSTFEKYDIIQKPGDRVILLVKKGARWTCFDSKTLALIKGDFSFTELVKSKYDADFFYSSELFYDKKNLIVPVFENGVEYYVNLLTGVSYYIPF